MVETMSTTSTNKQQTKKSEIVTVKQTNTLKEKRYLKNNNKLKKEISSGTPKGWLFVHCVQIELEFRNAGRGREPTTKSTHI